MHRARWMTGSLVGLALLMGSVAPAQARPRYDRGGWDHHRRDRGNGFGFGDAVGVAALVGAAAIVATSLSKDKKAAQASAPNDPPADGDYRDAPPPSAGTDYGADTARHADTAHDADFSDVTGTASQGNDQMVDDCALAARDEAQGQGGGYAEVRHMEEPRAANGGYNIDGEVESRTSYRAVSGTTRRFTCAIKDGRVSEVYLSRDVVTR